MTVAVEDPKQRRQQLQRAVLGTFTLAKQSLADFDASEFVALLAEEIGVDPSTLKLACKPTLIKVDAFKKRAQIKRRCGAKKKLKRAVLESADASPDEKAAAQEELIESEREEAEEMAALEAELAAVNQGVGLVFDIEIENADHTQAAETRAAMTALSAYAGAMK